MANHRATAALLLIASLLVAGANARPTVRPDKTAAALRGADVMRTGGDTMVTVSRDANGPGYVAVPAATAVVEPECNDDGKEKPQDKKKGHNGKHGDGEPQQPSKNVDDPQPDPEE